MYHTRHGKVCILIPPLGTQTNPVISRQRMGKGKHIRDQAVRQSVAMVGPTCHDMADSRAFAASVQQVAAGIPHPRGLGDFGVFSLLASGWKTPKTSCFWPFTRWLMAFRALCQTGEGEPDPEYPSFCSGADSHPGFLVAFRPSNRWPREVLLSPRSTTRDCRNTKGDFYPRNLTAYSPCLINRKPREDSENI